MGPASTVSYISFKKFDNTNIEAYCDEVGIKHEVSATYTPVDAGPTGYPAREIKDLVQLGFFPCNLNSRTIK